MPASGNNPNKAIPKKERNKEAEASKEGSSEGEKPAADAPKVEAKKE